MMHEVASGGDRSAASPAVRTPGKPFVFAQTSFPAPPLAPASTPVKNRTDCLPTTAKVVANCAPTTWDKVGVGLSALCTVKCLGVPVLAAALPIGGLAAYAHNPAVVWTFACFALPVAATQLIYKELKSGRFATPIAAIASSIMLSLGAIGHSISGNNLNSPNNLDTSASSTCMCGCSPHTAAAVVNGKDSKPTFVGHIQSNAHSNLLIGAIGLGLLHLNRFRRNYVGRKSLASGDCAGGDSCQCDSSNN